MSRLTTKFSLRFVRHMEKQFKIPIRKEVKELFAKYKNNLQCIGYSRYDVYVAFCYLILKNKVNMPLMEFLKYTSLFGFDVNVSNIYKILEKLNINPKPVDLQLLVERYGKQLKLDKKVIQKAKEIVVKLNNLGGKNPVPIALASLYLANLIVNLKSLELRELTKFGTTEVSIRKYIKEGMKTLTLGVAVK
jgi:transcription initiation factor TFIIIB Brf1 subunit/transcription initiation factor TFIIB